MDTPALHNTQSTNLKNPTPTARSTAGATDAGASRRAQNEPLFANPFTLEDLLIFDDAALRSITDGESYGMKLEDLARALHDGPPRLLRRIRCILPPADRERLMQEWRRPLPRASIELAQRTLLDSLFWELTYWKTPELYEELTEGEQLHPGIFAQLEPWIRGKIILDAGAGSGRASFECLRHGARRVYAVEPSPGLLRILEQKVSQFSQGDHSKHPWHPDGAPPGSMARIVSLPGRFDRLPLEENSVDVALSCSAFTAETGQGGEPGLAELKRVTKPGGHVVLIWPRTQDYAWLAAHGFHYVTLPMHSEMCVHFRSLQTALRCAKRFYARNRDVLRYLLRRRQPAVPFSVLHVNPPRDYWWLSV